MQEQLDRIEAKLNKLLERKACAEQFVCWHGWIKESEA